MRVPKRLKKINWRKALLGTLVVAEAGWTGYDVIKKVGYSGSSLGLATGTGLAVFSTVLAGMSIRKKVDFYTFAVPFAIALPFIAPVNGYRIMKEIEAVEEADET